MRVLNWHQQASRNCEGRGQHKFESESGNLSVLWQNRTLIYQDLDQHKFEPRSRNISVLCQTSTCSCQDRDQHKLESWSRNIPVLWQAGTATPFGIHNIGKGRTSTGWPTDSSITSQTTLYWGPACLTGKRIPNHSPAICGNMCSQSC